MLEMAIFFHLSEKHKKYKSPFMFHIQGHKDGWKLGILKACHFYSFLTQKY